MKKGGANPEGTHFINISWKKINLTNSTCQGDIPSGTLTLDINWFL